jgi:hypothetical protein
VFNVREGHRLGVFQNRELRKISGPNSKKVTGDWRKLHNEELHDWYSSLDRRHMRGGSAYGVLVGKAEKKNHLEDQGINGRVILKWIEAIYDGRV